MEVIEQNEGFREVNYGRIKNKTNPNSSPKIIQEHIPDIVVDKVIEECLKLVGDSDWNDPVNVSGTIGRMMNVDPEGGEDQCVNPKKIDRTVCVPSTKGSDIPVWICQSIIRVDEKFNNRYIVHNGALYNKIDIIFENERFKERMDKIANEAHCIWNARWGNSKDPAHRLYQKTRTGEESWLDRCVSHLITEEDVGGINIKNLVMIEFKRDLTRVECV